MLSRQTAAPNASLGSVVDGGRGKLIVNGMLTAPKALVRPRGLAGGYALCRPIRRTAGVTVRASAGLAHPGEEANASKDHPGFNPLMAVPDVTMAKGGGPNFGSGGSLGAGAVLEKSKLQFVMPTPVVQGPKLDDSGSGGDIGKNIFNGGGGDGGGDDDDDDYFNEDDGEDGDGAGGGGDGFFRTAVPELYDKVTIQAVLQEWFKTIADLPVIIRRAVEMGLFSSAQLVRFCAMDVRPNVTRAVSRRLPVSWSRELVGRLMADPAFVQKMVLEQVLMAGSVLYHEWNIRGERFKHELDLVAINMLGMMAATGACVWLVAPSRSYGTVHKYPWQQMLSNLPNCAFDASGPLRQYTQQARVGGFFARMAEMSAVGLLTGTAVSFGQSLAINVHQHFDPAYQPSVRPANLAQSSAGLAAFFAINANTRYQLIGGMDRYLFTYSNYLWTYLGMTGLVRLVSNRVGEMSRPWWQGLPTQSLQPKKVRKVRRNRKGVPKSKKEERSMSRDPLEDYQPALATTAAVATAAAVEGVLQNDASASATPLDGSLPLAADMAPLGGETSSTDDSLANSVGIVEDDLRSRSLRLGVESSDSFQGPLLEPVGASLTFPALSTNASSSFVSSS